MQVDDCYKEHCGTSPCAKHRMTRRLGVGHIITAPMLILLTTMAALYSSFETAHPALFVPSALHTVSYSTFKVALLLLQQQLFANELLLSV